MGGSRSFLESVLFRPLGLEPSYEILRGVFPTHPHSNSPTAELLFTRLTDSMFRLALVGLGGAKSACLVVERSQGVLRQSLLSSAALRFTEVHRGARYGVLALALGEEEAMEES